MTLELKYLLNHKKNVITKYHIVNCIENNAILNPSLKKRNTQSPTKKKKKKLNLHILSFLYFDICPHHSRVVRMLNYYGVYLKYTLTYSSSIIVTLSY